MDVLHCSKGKQFLGYITKKKKKKKKPKKNKTKKTGTK